MKYNMKKIMQNAWKFFRNHTCKTFADALRFAWHLEKSAKQDDAEFARVAGKKFEDGMEITFNGFTAILRRWTKGNHDRIYLNTNGTRKFGYVDLKAKKAYTDGKTCTDKMAKAVLSMTF